MTPTNAAPSVLGRLRAVIPRRSNLTYDEALRIAELQASKVSELLGVSPQELSEHHLMRLPHILVTYESALPVSGMSHWNGQTWVITLSRDDSLTRQRFTLLHEFKHIIDHGRTRWLYRGDARRTAAQQAEAAADYFAGCVLVPKRDLKSIWGRGTQRIEALADYFGVSMQAISVRLAQTKLNVERDAVPPIARCARPVRTHHSQSQKFKTARTGFQSRRFA